MVAASAGLHAAILLQPRMDFIKHAVEEVLWRVMQRLAATIGAKQDRATKLVVTAGRPNDEPI
jgi:hypothetical protein